MMQEYEACWSHLTLLMVQRKTGLKSRNLPSHLTQHECLFVRLLNSSDIVAYFSNNKSTEGRCSQVCYIIKELPSCCNRETPKCNSSKWKFFFFFFFLYNDWNFRLAVLLQTILEFLLSCFSSHILEALSSGT